MIYRKGFSSQRRTLHLPRRSNLLSVIKFQVELHSTRTKPGCPWRKISDEYQRCYDPNRPSGFFLVEPWPRGNWVIPEKTCHRYNHHLHVSVLVDSLCYSPVGQTGFLWQRNFQAELGQGLRWFFRKSDQKLLSYRCDLALQSAVLVSYWVGRKIETFCHKISIP